MLHYLNLKEGERAKPREAEIAKAIHEMANRVCAMLARQGTSIGTLYELTWRNLPDNEEARQSFHTAVSAAKKRMRSQVDKDEAALAEKMKGVIAPW